MTLNLSELERAAEKATPGPWWAQRWEIVNEQRDERSPVNRVCAERPCEATACGWLTTDVVCAPHEDPDPVFDANLRYIAAANPATVKALCAAIREMAGEVGTYVGDSDGSVYGDALSIARGQIGDAFHLILARHGIVLDEEADRG